jgi:hypothetical protein
MLTTVPSMEGRPEPMTAAASTDHPVLRAHGTMSENGLLLTGEHRQAVIGSMNQSIQSHQN